MSFFVERIIIKNRAPFESVDLTFKEQSISVLTAFNGKGKTTILSYIVDAWVELTKGIYSKSFEGRESSYYRVSSPLYDIMRGKPSLVYIRFKIMILMWIMWTVAMVALSNGMKRPFQWLIE